MSPQKFPLATEKRLNARRNLVKRHKLVGLYDEFLSNELTDFTFEVSPKLKDDGWHPSGHCLPGVTELYYHAMHPDEHEKFGVSMLKTFVVGHFWHQVLQHATLKLGLAIPESIERRGIRGWKDGIHAVEWGTVDYAPYAYCTGQGDVAPCTIPGHGEYLVDYKTMNNVSFKVTEAGVLPENVSPKYEAQVNIYMDFFNLEKALIVCVQKDTPHNFSEIEFHRNQLLIDFIYERWEFVSECIALKTPPDKKDQQYYEFHPDDFMGAVST